MSKYIFNQSNRIKKVIENSKIFIALLLGAILFLSANISSQAATYTVTKTADTNDGACNSDCSLREAIVAANAAYTDDVIEFNNNVFGTAQTITLNGTHLEIKNNGSLTIIGTGSNILTISANNQSRIFYINEFASSTINDLSITEGFVTQGGGIYNSGTLKIYNSKINGNRSNFIGGGIYNQGGNASLTITNSTISNNTVTDNDGGGITNDGTLILINSSISNNVAGRYGGGIITRGGLISITTTNISGNRAYSGGGISNFSGNSEITIQNSTINNNTAHTEGGGIENNSGILNLINTTISSNNTTVSFGGGISVQDSTVSLTNVTIAFNNAVMHQGGGVYNQTSGVVNSRNTIIAKNTSSIPGSDFRGAITSQGYNIIGNTVETTITGDTTGNQLNVDPLLAPLADNGGFTSTHALLSGSLAVDAANPNNFPLTDQRGALRPLDGDLNGSNLPDIGAFEVGAKIVTKIADTNDGVCDADCSLREAISTTNNSTANDSIVFSFLFNSTQTITLLNGELVIANSGTLHITGPGANLLTVSGNNASRVFYIRESAIATISDLKVTGGNGNGTIIAETGGGILADNNSRVTINNLIVSNNSTVGGGGIANINGWMTINNSTISNNSATSRGGGISNYFGPNAITINNSIISDNTTNDLGGGLYNDYDCTMNVNNSIISNNSALWGGGAFSDGTINLTDVNVTNNFATQSGAGISKGNRAVLNISTSNISQNSAGTSGGGVYVSCDFGGSLTVNSSTISNNTAPTGGGIFAHRCLLTVNLSNINDNRANNGGGIYNDGTFATQTLNNSNINNNTAVKNGGGIFNAGGTLNLENSTVYNNSLFNSTEEGGAGIYVATSVLNVTNSTISLNRTGRAGGGILNRGTVNLTNATINGNRADGGGGGIFNFASGTVNARNTIIADNIAATEPSTPDFNGKLNSLGYNLIEKTAGTTIMGTTTGNILGQDPQLLSIRNNGGNTPTVAPQPTSPVIDSADPNNFPAIDQRGIPRPQDGDLNGTSLPDIGAYERQVTVLTVTKTADTNDDLCDSDCSLREAIALSNSRITPDYAIIFDNSVFSSPQTIILTHGELTIRNDGTLAICGPGSELLTISGNNQSRVFLIVHNNSLLIKGATITGGNGMGAINNGFGGGVFNQGNLSIQYSVIRNNNALNGGGIRNDINGTLTLIKSAVKNNSTNGDGGGILNISGSTVNLFDSTINANSASGGGGIFNFGTALLNNSTVSGNSAKLFGGGILNTGLFGGVLNLTNSTISTNTAVNHGGGVSNESGVVNARNTIFSDNFVNSGNALDVNGTLASQGYNLIENTAGTTINGTTIGNILGVDPQLLPLGNYGGATQTHALRPTSPAIDKGNSSGTTTDQRGLPRPFDNPAISNASGGDGSDIGAFECQPAKSFSTAPFDFDGDGKSDISVFRPSTGSWYLLHSSNNSFFGQSFGVSTDLITPADFDGDGKTDFAVFRPDSGNWYLQQSANGFTAIQFGQNGDIPVPADYDGDGRADIAVYRPSAGSWYRLNSSNNEFVAVGFGTAEDKPTIGDFDGDGKSDIAVFRPSTGSWYRLNSSNNQFVAIQFGVAEDKPTPADFDGDGKTDISVYRPSTGSWYRLSSSNGQFVAVQFGIAEDRPVPADYDGDGKTDIAVFRPSDGNWYLLRSTSGFAAVKFGIGEDKPVPNALVS